MFSSRISSIEWMGAELYAYLPYEPDQGLAGQLDALAADLELEQMGGDEGQIVARLDATSRVDEDREASIWLDARKIHLFDPETGEALTRKGAATPAPR